MEVLECLNGKIGMLYKSYPKLPAIPEWDNTSLSLPVAGVVDTIFYKVLTLKKLYNSQLSALCKALILCLQRGRDSNPRYGFPYTHFPGVLLQPLGHLSVSVYVSEKWKACSFNPPQAEHFSVFFKDCKSNV